MELGFEDGSGVVLDQFSKTEIGRGLILKSNDRTVSRRHVILHPQNVGEGEETTIDFEVIGQNPIWVVSQSGSDKRAFRKFEKGKLRVGDRFSLSLKNPNFITLKSVEFLEEKRVRQAVKRRKTRTLKREATETACGSGAADEESVVIGQVDVSNIDPVKEFGFLVMGHEFENHPKQKIRDIRNWDWFLEESSSSENDEAMEERKSQRRTVSKRKKNRKDEDICDEDWIGESEDEQVKIARLRSSKRLRAAASRPKDKAIAKESGKQKANTSDTDEAEEDENDETLGGFIVDNDNVDEDEDEADLDVDEEEFSDEDREEDD